MVKAKRFGRYLRECRNEDGRSLVEVAEVLGVSHVTVSKVERGKLAPFEKKQWPKLKRLIPSLDLEMLEQLVIQDEGVHLDGDMPQVYLQFATLLARRWSTEELNEAQIQKLIDVIKP